LSLANEMGIEKVATGHYARTLDSALSGKNLLRGADAAKDQSYFLYRLDVSAFGRTIFPIGHLVKQQVRAIARNADLPVSSPRESQELCFLPNGGLENICREFINQATVPGPIFDKAGKKRGMHNGIALYTIGQRSGFGGGFEQPMYVIGIRANQNAIVIGTEDDLLATTFIVSNLAWIRNPQSEFSCTVRIRHRHRDAEALIKLIGSNAQIVFEKPQRAITPGQSAVFYDGPAVIGGGIIESVNTL
jgi:tRNA-specific 2-thiouridylase